LQFWEDPGKKKTGLSPIVKNFLFTKSFYIVQKCDIGCSKAGIMMISESRRSRKPPLSHEKIPFYLSSF
jgi:hypothetical protein